MIELFGPNIGTVKLDRGGDGELVTERTPGLDVSGAKTLQDAIKIYEDKFNAEVKPYDGSITDVPYDSEDPKYFMFKFGNIEGPFANQAILLDLHVNRNSKEICVRQDINFALRDGDIITFGMLAC